MGDIAVDKSLGGAPDVDEYDEPPDYMPDDAETDVDCGGT